MCLKRRMLDWVPVKRDRTDRRSFEAIGPTPHGSHQPGSMNHRQEPIDGATIEDHQEA
jgi:hypothetical protein